MKLNIIRLTLGLLIKLLSVRLILKQFNNMKSIHDVKLIKFGRSKFFVMIVNRVYCSCSVVYKTIKQHSKLQYIYLK